MKWNKENKRHEKSLKENKNAGNLKIEVKTLVPIAIFWINYELFNT